MITLLHPSRNRALQARKTHQLWMDNASKEIEIQHVLSLDVDDYQLQDYRLLFPKSRFVIAPNKNLVEATNNGAMQTDGDIIILVSDDFECPKNWDKLIVDAYKGHECKVLKVYDNAQTWIITLPIMDRAYYNKMGYFYHPSYFHMFCDTDMSHVADLTGSMIVRNDLIFNHAHYTTKQTKKDAVNVKADSTWEQGKKVYLDRVRNKFGLDVDVFKINAHNGHAEWLRTQLGI